MKISIHAIYSRIFKIWRGKRFQMFADVIKPSKSDRMLDVGGFPAFWIASEPLVGSIDSLNIHPVDWDPSPYPGHQFNILLGNGCDLEMEDKSYDIAFSNSVIEHVGDWNNQSLFAKEIQRVGKAMWLQTPAYECPIEPHYLMPFIHWFPKGFQRSVLRYFSPWGWLSKPSKSEVNEMVDTTRLLKYSEMKSLFPDCEIYTEKLLGIFPKSYVAIRRKA